MESVLGGMWKSAAHEEFGEHDESFQLIEGVSNQVLAFVVTAFVGILSLTTFLYKCFARDVNPELHPESMEYVEMTRNARNLDAASGLREGAFGRISTDSCPICLVPFRGDPADSSNPNSSNSSTRAIPVETNCGHLFCSECLLRFHQLSTVISALSCPVCRQRVTLLMWDRSAVLSNTREGGGGLNAELRQQLSSIQAYNRRFSGQPRSFIDILRDMPILIRHFVRNLFSVSGIRLLFRFRSFVFITTCLLYIVLPLDLLPEALFGILGLIDDIFIILCAVTWISIQYRNQMLEQD
ncbi:E3 ubiquitin-protein ligase RNF170-like [Convolutriloba macropyga]|uniref:E3 ubiquitin-protein ligase RNF170-like n=1 Tax=Convolutriloba macropyga TaxID=536237 RepID=UPI003F51E1B5